MIRGRTPTYYRNCLNAGHVFKVGNLNLVVFVADLQHFTMLTFTKSLYLAGSVCFSRIAIKIPVIYYFDSRTHMTCVFFHIMRLPN